MVENGNYSILVPSDYNFLLYLYHLLDESKKFPYSDLIINSLNKEEIRKKIKFQWENQNKKIKEKGRYIFEVDIEDKLINQISDLDEIKDKITSQFKSWWYFQSSLGYKYFLEEAISANKKLDFLRTKLGIESYDNLMILFDDVPEGFREDTDNFLLISQKKFFNYPRMN
ncbi:hypothetical protein CHH83_05805 [Bacillus sp. 7586-K]|nr:hypothetical protein CHH83_05805 [Bacillus sp. 7586-K]